MRPLCSAAGSTRWFLIERPHSYTVALQTLFGLSLGCFPAVCGVIAFFVTLVTLVFFHPPCLPVNPLHVGIISSYALLPPAEPGCARNAVNLLAFLEFLLYVHYTREHVERGAYTLRDQLKLLFKTTQKTQINERNAADSKQRLTLWVIPLDVLFVIFSMSL